MTAKKKPSAELAQLQEKLEQSEAARARLTADYANLERRVQEERRQIHQAAAAALLEELFPIFDNFYRASSHAPNVSLDQMSQLSAEEYKKIFNYFQGLKMIEKQMEEVLSSAGLRRIPTKGQLFNPTLHEAISAEASTEVPADYIIDEIEADWQIGERVVKPAKVRVSKGN